MTSTINNCAADKSMYKRYQCANGECTSLASLCPDSKKCTAVERNYRTHFCPSTGWCEIRDSSCLRPCGFENSYYRYKVPCDGYPGLCAQSSYDCPPVCSIMQPYKCLKEKQCAKGQNWCAFCSGFRCRSDGICISYYKKCNGHSDCSDGSDELSCYTEPSDPVDGNELGMEGWQIAAIGGGILLVLLLCCCWCCRKNKEGDGAQSTTATNQAETTTTSVRPRVTGATATAAAHPPSVAPYHSVYTPYPNYRPAAPGQAELGYVPMTTNNTPSSHPPAASSYPIDQPVASAPLPNENPTAAPPPSYSDVIENEDQYRPKDPALPTYEEYTESPSAKETIM